MKKYDFDIGERVLIIKQNIVGLVDAQQPSGACTKYGVAFHRHGTRKQGHFWPRELKRISLEEYKRAMSFQDA